MTEKQNKGGRPPRAPGEKMTRLSVMLRPIYREALDILAREQRTSISQALENLLSQALRAKKIEGKPLLEIAQGMVMGGADTPRGRLYRAQNQPFRTPEEQYTLDVIRAVEDEWYEPEEMVDLLERSATSRMLFDMIDECYKMGSPPNFCAQMYAEALKKEDRGMILLNFTDPAGIDYVFNLDDYFGEEE